MDIKRALFILFLCIVMSGCVIYRDKYFEPFNSDYYKIHTTWFWVGTFENWDVTIDFGACYGAGGVDPEYSDFEIRISASTRDREADEYRDTSYRANIKLVRILHGENQENEIDIGKTKLTVSEEGKKVFLSNERKVYIPPDIKSVLVIIEMEFIDKENNITEKKFSVPMKRIDDWSIGPIMV